jgi:hypothetical protein
MEDNITDFDDIEKEDEEEDIEEEDNITNIKKIHATNVIRVVPIFRLFDCKVIDLIYSVTDYSDFKICLHTKGINHFINLLCGTITWKDYLKNRVGRIPVKSRRN